MADTEVDRLLVRITADATLLKQAFEDARKKVKEESDGMGSSFSGFTTKLKDAAKELVSFRTAAVAAAGAVGIGALAYKALDTAGNLQNVAERANQTTTRLQEMQYAGMKSDISIDGMNQALEFFNKALGLFLTTHGGPAAQALKTIGLEAAISQGKIHSTGEALDFIIKNFSKYETEATAAGAASELFGRQSGIKMAPLLMQGSDALESLFTEAKKAGFVLSDETVKGADEAAKTIKILGETIERNGIEAIAKFAPQIEELSNQITASLPDLLIYVERWADWFGLIKMSPIEKIRGEILDLQSDMEKLEGEKGNNSWWWKLFGMSNEDIDTLIKGDKAGIDKLKAKLGEASNVDWAPGGKPWTGNVSQWWNSQKPKPALSFGSGDASGGSGATGSDQNQEEIASLKERINLMEKLNTQGEREEFIQAEINKLSKSATQSQRDQVAKLSGQLFDEKATAEQKKALDEANKSIDAQVAKLNQEATATELSDREKYIQNQLLETENTLRRKGIQDKEDEAAALDRVREAAGKAFDAQQDKANSKAVTDVWRSAYENMGNSIASAAAKGKLSLSTLGKIGIDVAQQIEEAFIKLSIINPIENALFGGTTGYTNLPTADGSSILGKIFGGSTTSDSAESGGITGVLSSLFGGFFAGGGDVDTNKYYVVGENGPELFVPSRSGTIVSNAQASGSSSSNVTKNQNITMHVHGVTDAKSFAKSESQIAAQMTRMLRRGQRNL
jgi:hypothetical protein